MNSNVSHYRVVSKIGAGGMGEVYRGRDERLDRDVAIKMLPSEVAKNEDRLRRFEQEAKATSALNHPNILTVYDIGEHDGAPFIVSELLDGEEMRDRLNDGRIPLRKTIDYAQQIVSGLSAAHEKGITHRDLKPENLFITKDDRVKILDFGLAKLLEIETNGSGSEDATKKALTDPGVVMGTVGYMSPEQVRGVPADHRSDIFSFGVILYEMLTGHRAFHGETVVETMHAILKDEVPDLDEDSSRVPPALDKLMRRCLEKRPERRFHSAHDLGFALDALASPTSSSGSGLTSIGMVAIAQSKRSKWSASIPWIAAGVFLASTLAVLALYFTRTLPESEVVRFSVTPPDKYSFSGAQVLSPDGRWLAFVAEDSSGRSLWLRDLGSTEARAIPGTDGAALPFWSPDSRSVAFFAANKLKRVDIGGGSPQVLADAAENNARGGAWGADGTILFAPDFSSPLYRVSAAGGNAQPVMELEAGRSETSQRWPSFLPDGRRFLYFSRSTSKKDTQGVYAASLDGGEKKLILASSVLAAYSRVNGEDHLLFMRDDTLMAQRFDTGSLKLVGEPSAVAEGVGSVPGENGPTAYAAFSASENGRLAYQSKVSSNAQMGWYTRDGKSTGTAAEPMFAGEFSFSPDGKGVVFARSGGAKGDEISDIWMLDIVRGVLTRLTFSQESEASPVWSRDGKWIFFSSDRGGGVMKIYRKPAGGAGAEELILQFDRDIFPDDWTSKSDGDFLLFETNSLNTQNDIWALSLTGGSQPYPLANSQFNESHSQFSPDGRYFAYVSDETGRAEVYVQTFPVSGSKWQISTNGGDQPQWRNDGKELFYIASDKKLMAAPITAGESFQPGPSAELFTTNVRSSTLTDERNNYAPAAGGQKFLVNNLVEDAAVSPITVVLNWHSILAKSRSK